MRQGLVILLMMTLLLLQHQTPLAVQAETISPKVSVQPEPQQVEKTHPYLVFTDADLAIVQAAVLVDGDPRKDMLESLEDGYLSYYDDDLNDGDDMFLNAVAYAVTEENKYYTRSRAKMLEFVNGDSCWDKSSGDQCRRDRVAGINMIKVGMTYDILYQSLSNSDRDTVRDVLFFQGCKQYEAATWGKNNTAEGWSSWWYNSYTNNHYTSSMAGLAVAAMVLEPEEDLLGTCSSSNKDGENITSTVSDWIDFVIANFTTAKIVWDKIEDGHWPEGDIYQTAAFAELTIAVYALDRLYGTSFTSSPIFTEFPQYYLYDSMPNQRWNNIMNTGDATSARRESFRYLKDLRKMASLYNDGLSQWLADQIIADLGGRPKSGGDRADPNLYVEIAQELFFYDPTIVPKSPDQLAKHRAFEATDAEEAFMWSDWGDNALVAAIHAGPPGGDSGFDHAKTNYNGRIWVGGGDSPEEFKPATAHVHADSNSFYLYGNGSYLIPEVAVYRDKRALWASSTTSHNTITIGGKDQIGGCLNNNNCTGEEEYVPFGNADAYHGKDEYWDQGNVGIKTFASAENYDFTVGDATDAYANSEGVNEFTRNIVFVERSYVVMMDDIRLSNSKQVNWYMHTQDGASLEGDWVKGLADNDNVVGIKVLAPSSFSFNTSVVDVEEEYDYTLQHLDDDMELHELRLRTTSALPRFITVFYPSTSSTWGAKPTVNLLNETNDGASVEVIHQSSEREVTLVNYGDTNSISLGNYTLDGKAASISFNSSGQQDGYFLAEGTSLKNSSLVTSAGSQYSDVLVTQLPAGATFEANYNGSDLTVSGSNLTQFVAYAPVTVQRLYLRSVNGNNRVSITEIPGNSYTQVGDYIYYNIAPPVGPPTADFISDGPTVLGDATSFTNQSTGADLSYTWNFGDGSGLVSTANPTHTYAAIGTYTVILTTTNPGGSDTMAKTVTVESTMTVPKASFTSSKSGLTISLASMSMGGQLSYTWNFGDGSPEANTSEAIHTYDSSGTYTVMLTATNLLGTDVVSETVSVAPVKDVYLPAMIKP